MALLSRHFVESIAASLGIRSMPIREQELNLLSAYQWPGNIRELKNVIERSLLLNMAPSACITGDTPTNSVNAPSNNSVELAEVEKQHILKILAMESGNKSAAARLLGVSRKTLERKVALWEARS